MSDIEVSIIIPVYNGSNYLREAIDSALAQTYPYCEVLVINDGSTDNGETEHIALSYGKRIRYFKKENGGVATALNLGIQEMRGKFFSWLSHDDVYLPHKIAAQIEAVSALPEDRRKQGIFMFAAYKTINGKGKPLYEYYPDAALIRRAPFYAVFKHMINGCTTLISRSLLLEAGCFRNLPTTQDYELWFRLIRLARPIYLPEVVLLSRLHAEQGFRTRKAREEAAETFTELMRELTEEEILACEPSREAFFAEVGRSMCEVDLKKAHDFAWSQASPTARRRYHSSFRHRLKIFLHRCGLLPLIRKLKFYAGKP